jgi:glycosyltransferase involved in cell wall biosynthesis
VKRRTHILFTSTFVTPFIAEDIKILQRHFSILQSTAHGWSAPFKFLPKVLKADITFSWFASVYSSLLVLLTRIFKKKSIIIIGGADVANEKEYNYGIWLSWWKSKVVKYGITHADYVLPVDESLEKEAMRLCNYDGKNISVVHTGYDSSQWFPRGKKEPFVLSVGVCPDMVRIMKKGFDILFAVAKNMSDTKFIIIGISPHIADQLSVPPNVQCIPKVAQKELLDYYQRAKVFTQLSRHEGMPNTLCEAMMCECIPVGSNAFGIPTAVGDAGFIVDTSDTTKVIEALRSALNSSSEMGKNSRKRIIEHFPIELREKKLVELINQLSS